MSDMERDVDSGGQGGDGAGWVAGADAAGNAGIAGTPGGADFMGYAAGDGGPNGPSGAADAAGSAEAAGAPDPADVGVDETLSQYYQEGDVEAVVLLKVDTQKLDELALKIAAMPSVEQAVLVTGDYDMVLRVRFADYSTFQEFIVEDLTAIDEVRESKTMMVVTTYKG